MSRDRGGGYGEAAARALPEAIQVADRWHLMENASCAFLDAVRRSTPPSRQRPARRPFPERLPRERVVIAAPTACPPGFSWSLPLPRPGSGAIAVRHGCRRKAQPGT